MFKFTSIAVLTLFFSETFGNIYEEDGISSGTTVSSNYGGFTEGSLSTTNVLPTEDPLCSDGSRPRGRIRNQRTLCAMKTACLGPDKEPYLFTVYLNSINDGPDAVAFIKETRDAQILRETDVISACTTISALRADTHPTWTKDSSPHNLRHRLRTHCFSKTQYAGRNRDFPYTALIKIQVIDQANSTGFEDKIVAYVLPNQPQYYIFRDREDLDQICTCYSPVGCGSFGQPGLSAATNLTSILNSLSRR